MLQGGAGFDGGAGARSGIGGLTQGDGGVRWRWDARQCRQRRSGADLFIQSLVSKKMQKIARSRLLRGFLLLCCRGPKMRRGAL